MAEYDAETAVTLLQEVQRLIRSRLSAFLAERGFSLSEAQVLHRLEVQPGLTLSELGRVLDHSKGHLSVLVEQLARDGFIAKAPDDRDRRLTRLSLTNEGVTFHTALQGQYQTFVADLLAGMDQRRLWDLVDGLEDLRRVLTAEGEAEG